MSLRQDRNEKLRSIELWNKGCDLQDRADEEENPVKVFDLLLSALNLYTSSLSIMYRNTDKRLLSLSQNKINYALTIENLLKAMKSVENHLPRDNNKSLAKLRCLKKIIGFLDKVSYEQQAAEKEFHKSISAQIAILENEPPEKEKRGPGRPRLTATKRQKVLPPSSSAVTLAKPGFFARPKRKPQEDTEYVEALKKARSQAGTQEHSPILFQNNKRVIRDCAQNYVDKIPEKKLAMFSPRGIINRSTRLEDTPQSVIDRAQYYCYMAPVTRMLAAAGLKDEGLEELKRDEFRKLKNQVSSKVKKQPGYKEVGDYYVGITHMDAGRYEEAITKLLSAYMKHLKIEREVDPGYLEFYKIKGKNILCELLRAINYYCEQLCISNERCAHFLEPLTRVQIDKLSKEKAQQRKMIEQGRFNPTEILKEDVEHRINEAGAHYRYEAVNQPRYEEYEAARKQFKDKDAKRFPALTKIKFRSYVGDDREAKLATPEHTPPGAPVFAFEKYLDDETPVTSPEEPVVLFVNEFSIKEVVPEMAVKHFDDIPNPADIHLNVGARILQMPQNQDAVARMVKNILAEGQMIKEQANTAISEERSRGKSVINTR